MGEMQREWNFYGRVAETAHLRAAFLAPEFDLIAMRGRHLVGKTWLIGEVMDGLPAGIPAVRHGLLSCHSPEAARQELLHDLRPRYDHASRSHRDRIPKDVLEAASTLASLPEILEHLLRAGINVAVDNAERLQDDGSPGLVGQIGDMARRLRREEAAMAGATVPSLRRRGALVLSQAIGRDPGPETVLDALGPGAVGRSMLLGPWSAADLVAVARDRGWLGHPRRLALLRTVIGGRPLDWEMFAQGGRVFSGGRPKKEVHDFAAFRSDRCWRLGLALYLFKNAAEFRDHNTDIAGCIEYGLEIGRIVGFLAKNEEAGPDTAAVRAAFPNVGPEVLDRRLAFMSAELGLIGEVPGPPRESLPRTGSGGDAGRVWRICDRPLRFWYDALRDAIEDYRWGALGGLFAAEALAGRMESMEEAALAQFLRECGPAWPADARMPGTGPAGPGRDGLPGARANPGPGEPGPVERRAFAFEMTAPGVLEGLLVPYGVPMCIGGAFDEVFEPGSLLADGLLVHVRHEWGAPLARSGQGLELEDGPGGLRATVTLPDTGAGRRVRARVEAGELTAFSAAFQALEEDWPAADRRIVRSARLVGLALVDRPEHETPLAGGSRGREGVC